MFVDRAKIHIVAGKGGDGAMSFRHEKYVEMGGPDGGNGGHGGDVIIVADPQKTTLYDFTYRPHYKAEPGGKGQGKNMTGRTGEDLLIHVPPGTLIYRDGRLMTDLKTAGDRYRAARGGRPGRGNASFKTAANNAPRISEKGEPGEDFYIELELKLLADVGLLGFPNAGKSTFLSVVSKATPKIANYPFTTLTPNLGVATGAGKHFVIADIPGIIEGAHTGKGLGDEFLRHVERTRVLIHLVDAFGFDEKTAFKNLQALNRELALYSPRLADKPQIVALTKMDLTGADKMLAAFRRSHKKGKVMAISAATGQGVKELLNAVVEALDKAPEAPVFAPERADIVLEPDFEVEKLADKRYKLVGRQIARLAAITNFDQDESIARLQKIFKKMGVEDALRRSGAVTGDAVEMGDHEFTYRVDEKSTVDRHGPRRRGA